MIVFDQKQDRDLMDRGDIERFVELARARAAVADDRQAEDLLAVAARRPGSAHDDAQHLAQVADHGEPPRRRVAMMDIALAGVRWAIGIGQVLAKELIGRGAQQQVAAQGRGAAATGHRGRAAAACDMPIAVASLPALLVTVPLTYPFWNSSSNRSSRRRERNIRGYATR